MTTTRLLTVLLPALVFGAVHGQSEAYLERFNLCTFAFGLVDYVGHMHSILRAVERSDTKYFLGDHALRV